MKKTLKRTLATIMVVLIVMMSAPISGLISADLSDSIGSNIRVKAATEYTLYWPVPTSSATIGRISSAFGPRKSPTSGASSNHRGVDIPVASGTPVYAVYDGVVVAVGKTSARGNYVVLYHSSIGLSTLYQHLTRAIVQKGSSVSGGSQIALSGNTGIGTGAHLHYGVMVGKATKVDNDQPSYNMAINPLGTNITYYSVGKENISDTNISLFDYNATFIVKASSKTAKTGPLSSYDTTRTISKDSKVNVVAYCYNEYGNLWYKTDKGDYIYESYLEAASYESLPPSNYNPSKYKVICSSKNIKNDPVSSSDTIGTVKQNQEVSVIGYLYNEYGNLWYELEDGGYLAHTYLSVVSTEKTSPSNYLNENMIVRSSSKTVRRDPYGEADELRTVSSDSSIQVHGYVYNQYGNVWYMTADEEYLYSSYLEPVNIDSSAPTRYSYQEFYASDDKVEKYGPYDASENIDNIPSGSKITTIGYVVNLYGNKWYETVDGGFIHNSNLHTYLFDYNATFIAKESKVAKSGPVSSYDTTRTIAKDTKVNVVAYCYNEYGNLWYKTDKGDYIYESYLEADSYDVLPPSNYNFSTYKVMCSSKDIRNEPTGSSRIIGTLKQNQEVSVIGYLYNEYGNLWYVLEDGGYLAHTYLSVVSTEKTSPSNYLNESMIVKSSGKSVRRDPYATADELRTVSLNTSVQMHGYVYNRYGNLWYMTNDEEYLYFSYLESTNTSSSAPSKYSCQEFYAGVDKVEKSDPYNIAEILRNIASGSKIDTVGYVINMYGNKWYLTTEDGFVYNSNLTCAHSYTSTITTAPTCTQAGVKTFTCSKCGDKYTETIAKKGHTEVTVTGKAATCTATGLTDGKKCSVCGTVTVAQKTIAKKAHTEVVDKAVSATCTKTGLTEGKHCSVCNTVILAQTVVPVKNHSYSSWKQTKAPTCTSAGEKQRSCSSCGKTEKQAVAIIDHTYTTEIIEPTCSENGMTIYICSECRYSYNEDIPATGHADKDSDGACDDCSEVMADKSEKCSCLCHKSGFMGFIWKILRIFYKLFKANPVCNCGEKHY